MKYKLAIIDDEQKDIDSLINIFSKLKKEKGFDYEIYSFNDSVAFLNNFKKNKYNAIFTDMYMPNLNGIEMCKKIREIDNEILIVLTTNFAKYAIDGYSINAFDFVLKPVNEEAIIRVINRFLQKSKQEEEKIINTKIGSNHYRFEANEIFYIESFGHTLTWVTKKGKFTGTGSLSKLEKILPSDRFTRCSNSYIVNLNLIDSIKKRDININDFTIHITKTYEKTFMSKFADALKSL